jgi:hypothetical protein
VGGIGYEKTLLAYLSTWYKSLIHHINKIYTCYNLDESGTTYLGNQIFRYTCVNALCTDCNVKLFATTVIAPTRTNDRLYLVSLTI